MSKFTISMPEDLVEWIRERAEAEGKSVSASITEIIKDEQRHRALREAVEAYEAEHGVITEEEREEVRAWLKG